MVDEGSAQSPNDCARRFPCRSLRRLALTSGPHFCVAGTMRCLPPKYSRFFPAPASLIEDNSNEAALALISSLDANDPSSFATEFPSVPARRLQTVMTVVAVARGPETVDSSPAFPPVPIHHRLILTGATY